MNRFKQIRLVTLWEYKRFFKPKNELLGLLIMLVVSVVVFFGTRYVLSDEGSNPSLTICETLDTEVADMLGARFDLEILPEERKNEFLLNLEDNEGEQLLVQEEGGYVLYAYKKNRNLNRLRSVLDALHLEQSLREKGLDRADFDAMTAPATLKESYIYTGDSRNRVVLSYFFAGLMIMAVFLSFAYQFTAITGEKQIKITEQIVSAIKPQVWMDGKILGITLTGLSSMLTYSLFSIIGASLLFQFTGTPLALLLEYIHLPSIFIYLAFSLVGVLIWNALMAAIASLITDPNNSGKSSLMMLPVLFVAASFLVVRDPDGSLAIFLSWFPLTSATAMPMRWAITEVAWWNLPASMGLLVAAFYFFRKLAARIFRISILISGKEPSWGEVFRLMKNAA